MEGWAKYGFKKIDKKTIEEEKRSFKPVSFVKPLDPIVSARLQKDIERSEKERKTKLMMKEKNKVLKKQKNSLQFERRKYRDAGIIIQLSSAISK